MSRPWEDARYLLGTQHMFRLSLDPSPIFGLAASSRFPPSTRPYTTTSVLHPDKTQLRSYSFASHWFPYFLLDKVQVPKYTSKSLQ